MSLLLGIDLGTSYFKVGLFDEGGVLKGLGRVAVQPERTSVGRCELDVSRFWALLRRGLAEALDEADANAREITAVSYSSQANSFVLLDEGGATVTPLILWTDGRAEPAAPDLLEFSRGRVFSETVGFSGWAAGFAVAKLRWLQDNEPATWARARRVMTIADYLSFSLTGEYVGDASTAAFLGLYDLGLRQWWPEALAASRIDEAKLSSPLPPGAAAGRTAARAMELIGLPAGVAFAVGGLDHHVAALGAGLGKIADVSISTGTVLAAMTLVSMPRPTAGCFHGPHFDGAGFYRLAFNSAGAVQLEDYQRKFGAGLSLEKLFSLAESAPSGGSRGMDLGRAEPGIAMRYLLENIAATQRDLIRQVNEGKSALRIVATGGGARSALWLQIKADMFDVPVVTTGSPERACLGAAMLAGVAAGWHRDTAQAMEAMLKPGRVFSPDRASAARYRELAW